MARENVQEQEVDFQEVSTPVAKFEAIHTLLAASMSDEIYVHHINIISVYVQDEPHDEILTKQPEYFVLTFLVK